MGIIFFVRHGESESNKLLHDKLYTNRSDLLEKLNLLGDPSLTDKGIKQSQYTAEYLFKKITQKYSHVNILISPIQRTVQTATPFIHLCESCESNQFKYTTQYLPELQEYTSPTKNIKGKLTCLGNPLIVDTSWDNFCSRVLNIVNIMEDKSAGTPTVIFGHSRFISTVCSFVSSQKNHMVEKKSDVSFQIPSCSITPLSYNNNHWDIYRVGSIEHLPESLQTGTHY